MRRPLMVLLYVSFRRAMFSVELRARALGDPLARALLGAARSHARRLAVLRVHQRHVGDVDGTLALDHADLRVGPRGVRALVALDEVDTLDVDPVPAGLDAD